MDDIIELLIDELDTLNGHRGSSFPVKKYIHEKKYKIELQR